MAEHNPIYVVTQLNDEYIIKRKEELNGDEDLVHRNELSEAKRKEIIDKLPNVYPCHYIFRDYCIYQKGKYKENRKKRSISDYQRKQGYKLENILRENNKILTVGDKIKLVRLSKGYTLRELAKDCNVFYLTIHQLENGSCLTSKEKFENICAGLGIKYEDMEALYIELKIEFARKRA